MIRETPSRSLLSGHLPLVGGIIAWLFAATAIYQPHIARPFDVIDFPQIRLLMEGVDSFAQRLVALTSFDRTQGRFRLVEYLIVALKWSVFGRATTAWQLASAIQMSALAGMMYVILRRWHTTRLGAGLATTLVLCSHVAMAAWMRSSILESIGSVLLLIAVGSATRLEGARHPKRVLLGVFATIVAMLLLKEMYVAAVPAVWFSGAATGADGALRVPRRTRRSDWLALTIIGACALALVPVALTALDAPAAAYARQFGAAQLNLGSAIVYYAAVLVPFVPATVPMQAAVVCADLAFVFLLLTGWNRLLQAADDKRPLVALLCFAVAFPICCGIAYLPWPEVKIRYGIPYLLGPAVLVAFAVTGIQRSAPRFVGVAVAAWVVVSVYMASIAYQYARRVDASLRLMVDVTHSLTQQPVQDSVLFAICDVARSDWERLQPVIVQYAWSEGDVVAPGREGSCEEGRTMARMDRRPSVTVIISDRDQAINRPSHRIAYVAKRFDWRTLAFTGDTVRADIVPASP